jgi:hypothetical protein
VTVIPIYAELTKGDLRLVARVFADGDESAFSIDVPAGTRRLVIDPHGTILTAP